MKHFALGIMALVLTGTMHSCCTKKDCPDDNKLYRVQFYNFSAAEMDSIAIYGYAQNSGFSTPIDSFFTKGKPFGDFYSAEHNYGIDITMDYRIRVGSATKYDITAFNTDREGCNECFPWRPSSDYYTRVTSYTINDKVQEGNVIKVYK